MKRDLQVFFGICVAIFLFALYNIYTEKSPLTVKKVLTKVEPCDQGYGGGLGAYSPSTVVYFETGHCRIHTCSISIGDTITVVHDGNGHIFNCQRD